MIIVENIIAVIFVLGVMILVHELGHFLAARYFDVRVEAFSFGFGPRLFGRRRGDTDYRVCLLPLGGYVKMAGEQPGDEHTGDPREFMSKPRWQRLIIALMGPAMNVVLAVALLVGLYMVRFERLAVQQQAAVLGDVDPNSPAAKAGLREGDRIVAIDGKQNPTWEDVTMEVVSSAKRPIDLRVERAGKQFDISLTPTLDPNMGIGYTGWAEQVPIQLGDIAPGMPAEKGGLKSGDVLVAVNGEPIQSRRKLPEVLQQSGGRPVVLEFMRGKEKRTATLTPVYHQSSNDGSAWRIGVVLVPKYDRIATRLSFPEAL
ncbi:MAG: RIP metalloprotease RseP, partial [Acidobacteria bacterium]|nr:RIP metalloprotease RseP [Acidobacteriota bacterium]